MSNYGIKITKDGYDTSSASIPNQILNSSCNSLKIVAEGQTTISVNGDNVDDTVTISHGRSNIPAFLAFAQLRGSSTVSYPLNSYDLFSGSGEGFKGVANSSNIVFTATDSGTAYTATIYYYIFAEPSR